MEISDGTHGQFVGDAQLREALAASEQRNRELQAKVEELSGYCQGYATEAEIGHEEYIKLLARLDAAEELVAKWRNRDWFAETQAWGTCADELEAAITPTPSQPAAGEERTTT